MAKSQKLKRQESFDVEVPLERARWHGPRPNLKDEDVCRPQSAENNPELHIHHITLSFEKNEPEIIQQLEKLIQDPNYDINKYVEGYALIHRACLVGKPNVLEQLIKHGADINKRTCYGDTPLMCVIQRCNACDFRELFRRSLCPNEEDDNYGSIVCYTHIRCAKLLLNQPNIDLDAVNDNGLSALSFASSNIDELKRDKYVKLLLRLNENESLCSGLYKALQGKLDSQFVMELNLLAQKIGEAKTIQFMFKNYTFLQVTCKFGMLESSKRLIEMGADVHFAPLMKQRPIQLACRFAQPHILEYLIQKQAHILPNGDAIITKNNRNLIHQTAKSFADKAQCHKCLKILLKEKTGCIGDVNDSDDHGRTPLHYAVAHDNEPCVIELLENGALIDIPDKWKRTPLMHINPHSFKKYLNNMISSKTETDNFCVPGFENRFNFRRFSGIDHRMNANVKQFRKRWRWGEESEWQNELTFNFETLFRKQDGHYFFPTDFLRDIKKEKRLRKLIAHPVFSLLIHFKWQNVRIMFYVYLFLYMLFCISFTVLVIVEVDLRNNSVIMNNGTLHPAEAPFFTEKSAAPIFLNTMLSIFALLEILKMIGDIKKYVMNLDNILRVIVITLSFIVIQCLTGSIFDGYCPRLKAVAILITWFELFLVTGKHPKLSFHVTTFRSASYGLLKFLIIHFVLLLGFALSFHTLFRSDASDNIFANPLYATFKTIVMLTSEFDAGEIPFHGYTGISHLIFIAYIFIATIVLFNLMIGLAFSKVNEMEKNPSLYESLAQIDIITHFEDYFYRSSLRKRFHYSNCCEKQDGEFDVRIRNDLEPKVIIKKDQRMERILKFESEGKIIVLDVKKLEKLKFFKVFKRLMPDYNRISNKIVEKARKIVSKKISPNEESKEEIINLNTKLDAIANELVDLKNLIDDLKNLQRLKKE